jgi:DNA-binding XRE family transcriptional regulator
MVARMKETFTGESAPAITLRRDKLDELRRANGIESEAELARIIGVSPTTLWRISRGDVVPSPGFIARTLLAFPHAKFETLFAIARPEPMVAA